MYTYHRGALLFVVHGMVVTLNLLSASCPLSLQVNKATAPLPLQLWRKQSKEATFRIMLGRHQVLRLRNWFVKASVLPGTKKA